MEALVATLQSKEDQDKNDFDYGGTSRYLGKDEQPNVIASLIDNGTGRIKFLDAAYHRLGTYGDGCAFYDDEIYHAGRRLSIWLRHEFLRGSHVTNIDRGGWAPIDELVQDDDFWRDVHRELIKHGHEQRKVQTTGYATIKGA